MLPAEHARCHAPRLCACMRCCACSHPHLLQRQHICIQGFELLYYFGQLVATLYVPLQGATGATLLELVAGACCWCKGRGVTWSNFSGCLLRSRFRASCFVCSDLKSCWMSAPGFGRSKGGCRGGTTVAVSLPPLPILLQIAALQTAAQACDQAGCKALCASCVWEAQARGVRCVGSTSRNSGGVARKACETAQHTTILPSRIQLDVSPLKQTAELHCGLCLHTPHG